MMLTPLDVPALLRRYGLRPDKRLGQNFLIDPNTLEQVVEIAGVTSRDTVLEIGPGLGNLTRVLAVRAGVVIAVEIDGRFLPALKEVLAPFENVDVLQGDILRLNPAVLLSSEAGLSKASTHSGYQVVANIPYNITSALIRHLLEAQIQPARMTLTVQLEVAERICAAPGDLSLLALSAQVYGHPDIKLRIPAAAFYPPPKVDSAVVRLDLYSQPRIPRPRLPAFFRLAKAGFSQKRKTLRNALAGGMHWEPGLAAEVLQNARIDPMRRAETLSLEEWAQLVDAAANQLEG